MTENHTMTEINDIRTFGSHTWNGVDLRGRQMIYPPWSPKQDNYSSSSWPQPAEIIIEILTAFKDEGGKEEELYALLNDHMPQPDYIINSEILKDGSRRYSLEFYFYFFTFCKMLLKNVQFHFINPSGSMTRHHYISEKGFLLHPPWHGDEMKREGYLSLTNVRALMVYAEEKALVNEAVQGKITGRRIADEVLIFLNQSVEEQYRVQRQFFDKEEVQVSFEYLLYMISFFEYLFNSDNYISQAFRYGFLHSHHLVQTYFLQTGKSPDSKFKEWLLSTNSVYHLSFSEKRKAISVRVDVSRLIEAGMIGPYLENSFSRIKQAVPVIFKSFFEIATGGKVQVHTKEVDKFSFTVLVRWGHPTRLLAKGLILLGIWGASNYFFSTMENRMGYWIHPMIYTVLSFLIITFYVKIKILNEHQKKIGDLVSVQMNSLETVTKELIQERDGLYETVRDRTRELEKAVTRLKDLDRSKTNFIANVSHELRTPLTLISTPLEEIRNGRYGEAIQRNSPVFHLMKRNTDRLQRQISQLLDFARFDLGIQPLKKVPVNIIKFCSDLITEVQSLAESKGLTIRFFNRTSGGVIFIEADIQQLETLMMNLIGNALKFTTEGGVTLSVLPGNTPEEVQISIRDTGIGFTADQQKRIFERFFQAEENKERRYEGAGLGLSLVKEIALHHRWMIEVEGSSGRGACFTLHIAVSTHNMAPPAEDVSGINRTRDLLSQTGSAGWSPSVPERMHTDRILIVDDNPDMATILSDILNSKYCTDWSPNGPEALSRLSKNRDYSLIICDIMMPGMSGLDFRKRFLASSPDQEIPFIFLTALVDQSVRKAALELGGVDYILKPFNTEELLLKINNLIQVNRGQYSRALRDSEGVERLLRLNEMASSTSTDDFMNLFNISRSEKRVIELLRNGLQDKEIAENLNISPRTVSTHLRNIYKKTGTQNRVELLSKLFY